MSKIFTSNRWTNRIPRWVASSGLKALVGATMIAIGSSAATAGPIGFSYAISGDVNVPTFALTNQSDTAQITGYTLTIGDTAFNFDGVNNSSQGYTTGSGSFTLNFPDTNLSGGIRSDLVSYAFTGFDPTEVFSHDADVDPDNSDVAIDFRDVLFNNGSADNAVLTVSFLDAGIAGDLSLVFDDGPELSSYLLTASGSIGDTPVPEPGMLALFGIGFAGLGAMARRRAKRA